MPYRGKKNNKRWRRARRYMSTAQQALNLARSVKAIVNSEKKTFDTNLSGFISLSGALTGMTNIRQGDDYMMRNGRSILVKSIQIIGNYQVNPDSGSNPNALVRFILFVDNAFSGVAATVDDVLGAGGNVNSLRNPEPSSMKRFHIIYDKQFKMTKESATYYKRVDLFKKLNHHVKYDGTAADDYNTGALFLLRLSDQATGITSSPQENLNIRVRFYDN